MKLKINAFKLDSGLWAFNHQFQNSVNIPLFRGTQIVLDHYFELVEKRPAIENDRIDLFLSTNDFDMSFTQLIQSDQDETCVLYNEANTGIGMWLCKHWLEQYFGILPQVLYAYAEKADSGQS